MSVERLILAGGIVAGGFWAYRNGHLDPVLDRLGIAPGGGAVSDDGSASDTWGGIFQQNAGDVLPASGGAGFRALTKEEKLLRDHWDDVQPWARANRLWTACMMWQESRGNTNAVSSAGARGLLQVMPGTMGDLYNWGYNRYSAEPMLLHTPQVGIYFGTAYLQYLSKKSSDREWITRAYNAGPGGKRSNGTWPAETVNYLKVIKQRYEQLTSKSEIA